MWALTGAPQVTCRGLACLSVEFGWFSAITAYSVEPNYSLILVFMERREREKNDNTGPEQYFCRPLQEYAHHWSFVWRAVLDSS